MKKRIYNPIIENLSRSELKSLQWKKLKYQLEYQYNKNAFYRRLFDQHQVKPDDIRSPEDFRTKIPSISKKDLLSDQQENSPFGRRTGLIPSKLAGLYLTSGTSGLGQELYGVSQADQVYAGQTWAMGLHWSGVDRGDVSYNTWPGSVGQLAGPDSLTRSFSVLGTLSMHVGSQDTQQKLNTMLKFKPNQITIVPAYLSRFTVMCGQLGIEPRRDFPNLKSIMTATESFSTSWVEKMEEFWGAKIHEMYGSTQQGGGLAFTCECGVLHNGKRGHLHILEHMAYVEVLNRETREPVGPGEEGEIFITNLDREASPLIRFATDDKVVFLPNETCECGRPFDSFESGKVARYDDMIKIKSVNVWPSAVESVLFAYDEVEEYRGRVYISEKGEEKVLLTVEFKKETPNSKIEVLVPIIEKEVRAKVGVRMEIEESNDSLPRFEFKVRRWTDERINDRDRILYTTK